MINSTEKVGERIRTERLRASMTQTDLAGDRISRNMLSMIERGETLPSLETLEYLANRLGVPAGLFLSDSDATDALYAKTAAVSKARELFAEKKYADCADVCRSVPFDDELNYLLSEALFADALDSLDRFRLQSAKESLKLAGEAAKRSVYASESLTGSIEAYLSFIPFAAGDIDKETVAQFAKKPTRIPAGKFVFLTLLSYLDGKDFEAAEKTVSSTPFLGKDEMKYYTAKLLSRDFKFTKAIELFKSIEDSAALGFITKYRIAADIESCYENKRDFESAYKYSTKKHRILEMFSK